MKPAEEIERTVKHISFQASRAMDEHLWADIARAGNCRPDQSAPDREDIRRLIMRMSTTQIAIAALVLIGAGAITAVGLNIGRYYYYGRNDAGDYIFVSEDREDFVTMDANGVTDVEQTRTDLEEMKILSQQGRKELLRVKETTLGNYRLKTHEYRYQLSDGRTRDMGEPADDMPVYSQEQWKEFSPQLEESRRLREAGPGEDLGTYEETVEGRVFCFKREKYLLDDGTEVIWSVGTPKDGH
ncbi:MAG: hypothetical protein JW955_08610 [Sedimentisphaerales bacterium]|nr:hypothetical protein [Sedimentisphaerales bacterium]